MVRVSLFLLMRHRLFAGRSVGRSLGKSTVSEVVGHHEAEVVWVTMVRTAASSSRFRYGTDHQVNRMAFVAGVGQQMGQHMDKGRLSISLLYARGTGQ